MFRNLILSTVTIAALAAPVMTATTAFAGSYGNTYEEPTYHEDSSNYGHKKQYYQNCYKKAVWGWNEYHTKKIIIRYKTICNY